MRSISEKTVSVRTSATQEGYSDSVSIRGFNERDNTFLDSLENLRNLNRLVLLKYNTSEVTAIVKYQNGTRKLIISFDDGDSTLRNFR